MKHKKQWHMGFYGAMELEAYPAKLIGMLIGMGYDVEEKCSGIYYVTGKLMFPVQIIVTSQMESDI